MTFDENIPENARKMGDNVIGGFLLLITLPLWLPAWVQVLRFVGAL